MLPRQCRLLRKSYLVCDIMGISIDVDLTKARTLLWFLARNAKKIKVRNQSLKQIHKDILQIKRACAKSAHPKISHLETNILDALRKGGFVEECKPCTSEAVEEIARVAIEDSFLVSNSSFQNRDEKLRDIEQRAVMRAQSFDAGKAVFIKELSNVILRLEKIKKGIKVHSSAERLKLKDVCSRIDSLKKKLTEIKRSENE